ncbi:MAG TPA: hypothetical protein VMD97_13475 [Candidatus Aquilonibacter sp.]|nr:hypothetical protein [Candidatus Aquilonibacter sp.]
MASVSQALVRQPSRHITGRNGIIDKYFYFAMSLLVIALVVYGFGHTANENLFHPDIPRPRILWIHAATFSTWTLFFLLQSALVRTHNVRIHRTLGWFGVALGAFMIPLGLTTAVIMTRFHVQQLHQPEQAVFQGVQWNDMLCFTTFFLLAIYWRRKPELHRRSIFIATAVLLAAAFGRVPFLLNTFYIGVDGVILLGVLRDLLVNRRVHMIYRVALPAVILTQSTAMYLLLHPPAWWSRVAHAIAS